MRNTYCCIHVVFSQERMGYPGSPLSYICSIVLKSNLRAPGLCGSCDPHRRRVYMLWYVLVRLIDIMLPSDMYARTPFTMAAGSHAPFLLCAVEEYILSHRPSPALKGYVIFRLPVSGRPRHARLHTQPFSAPAHVVCDIATFSRVVLRYRSPRWPRRKREAEDCAGQGGHQ